MFFMVCGVVVTSVESFFRERWLGRLGQRDWLKHCFKEPMLGLRRFVRGHA